jgi:stage II sporulation protein M
MINDFIKTYLFKIKGLSFFLSVIFIISIILGYYIANKYPDKTEEIIYKSLKDVIEPAKDYSSFQLLSFIFFKNLAVAMIAVLSGIIFGFVPVLIIFVNGLVLGVVSYIFIEQFNIAVLLSGLLPHGIIEIPAIILSTASGLLIWRSFYRYVLYDENNLKNDFISAIKFFLLIITPMLIIAALIETFITPHILDLVISYGHFPLP